MPKDGTRRAENKVFFKSFEADFSVSVHYPAKIKSGVLRNVTGRRPTGQSTGHFSKASNRTLSSRYYHGDCSSAG